MYNIVIPEEHILIVIFVFNAKYGQGSMIVNCPTDAFLSIGCNKVIIQILILQSLGGETSTYCAIISICLSAIRFSKKFSLVAKHYLLKARQPAAEMSFSVYKD